MHWLSPSHPLLSHPSLSRPSCSRDSTVVAGISRTSKVVVLLELPNPPPKLQSGSYAALHAAWLGVPISPYGKAVQKVRASADARFTYDGSITIAICASMTSTSVSSVTLHMSQMRSMSSPTTAASRDTGTDASSSIIAIMLASAPTEATTSWRCRFAAATASYFSLVAVAEATPTLSRHGCVQAHVPPGQCTSQC